MKNSKAVRRGKSVRHFWVVAAILVVITGCGYSTGSLLSPRLKTIHVKPFKNRIDYSTERDSNIYVPLLEVQVTNGIIDRFLFDGNLKIVDEDRADLILYGELLDYDRDPLRYTDNNDVQEYRISIVVSLKLYDVAREAVMWEETRFAGDADYFVTGPQAKSENEAIEKAVEDLAKRVVERTIENW